MHKKLDFPTRPLARGFAVAAFKVIDNALKGRLILCNTRRQLTCKLQLFVACSVENGVYPVLGNVF